MEILQKAALLGTRLVGNKITSSISSNKQTVETYSRHTLDYINNTYQEIDMFAPEMREWIDAALASIPLSGKIFEIGSATLRDASYMRKRGFYVTCSDAATGFVALLKKQGEAALHFNVLEDEVPESYDMVFANGVMPHFTPHEASLVLQNIYSHLPPDGVLAFSVKYGVGEEWIKEKFDDGRFTHYWKLEAIFDLLKETGFVIVFENSNTGSFPSHRWLNIVCKKSTDLI